MAAYTPLSYTDGHSTLITHRECQFTPDFQQKNKLGERVVAIIGCTYVFTDSIMRAELKNGISRLVFCDISAQKAQSYLAMAGQAAGRICPDRSPAIRSRTSLPETVKDADTVYVGLGPSFADTRRVLETYQKHGVFVTIGDTLYSPGLIQWLLEYRALVQIRQAVNEYASPDAVIFATANPLPEVVATLNGDGENARPAFGFCCGTKDLRRLFESYLGAENASLTLEYACRNHLGLVRLFDAAGRNVLPDLLDRLHPDRLLAEIEAYKSDPQKPEYQKALENWPLATILHKYYDPDAGTAITSESGVHGIEYLPRLFTETDFSVKYPAKVWEHDLFCRQEKSEENRSRILADPLGYEQKTAWATGRFDPWSQVLRNLRQDPELAEKDLRNWGPAYANVPNGDLFPELPPTAIVEVPTAYHEGQMFVYRNSVPLSDTYLEMIAPQLQMAEMARCIPQAPSRNEAAELFTWLIDSCPLVNAYIPYQEARIELARDLLETVPNII